MKYNAYILDWTMNNYTVFKQKLQDAHFNFIAKKNNPHLRVEVSFARVQDFFSIVRMHLNTSYNYIDIQFPSEKITVLIFSERVIFISNEPENEAARKWAISKGLPIKQADWSTSY